MNEMFLQFSPSEGLNIKRLTTVLNLVETRFKNRFSSMFSKREIAFAKYFF